MLAPYQGGIGCYACGPPSQTRSPTLSPTPAEVVRLENLHDGSKCTDSGEDCCAHNSWGEPQTCSDDYLPVPTSVNDCPTGFCAEYNGGIGCYVCIPPTSASEMCEVCKSNRCTSDANDCIVLPWEKMTCRSDPNETPYVAKDLGISGNSHPIFGSIEMREYTCCRMEPGPCPSGLAPVLGIAAIVAFLGFCIYCCTQHRKNKRAKVAAGSSNAAVAMVPTQQTTEQPMQATTALPIAQPMQVTTTAQQVPMATQPVVLPEGAVAGQQLQLPLPDGRLVNITVPKGVLPGQQIMVRVS